MRLIPGWGRPPGEGHGNPLQYSCREDPTDRGAWRAEVHGTTKSQTQPKRLSMRAMTEVWNPFKKIYWSVCCCSLKGGVHWQDWALIRICSFTNQNAFHIKIKMMSLSFERVHFLSDEITLWSFWSGFLRRQMWRSKLQNSKTEIHGDSGEESVLLCYWSDASCEDF